jgi:hypothetical protein
MSGAPVSGGGERSLGGRTMDGGEQGQGGVVYREREDVRVIEAGVPKGEEKWEQLPAYEGGVKR